MATDRQPGALVYLAGVATSALALYGVRVLNDHGEYIMGWYANGILPAGALLVGMVSGTGFAIASRFLNVRLTRSYVLGMLTTGVLDYVVATYLTYSNLLEEHHATEAAYSFLQYVQDVSENMSFTKGSPLGKLGYVYKVLEMTGFALGTMMPAAALFKMPFCGRCQKYLVGHKQGFLSSSIPRSDAVSSKRTREMRQAAVQGASEEMGREVRQLWARMSGAPLAQVEAALAETTQGAKKGTSLATVAVTLKKCPQCDAHHVAFRMDWTTLDKKKAFAHLPAIDATGAAVDAPKTAGAQKTAA